MFRICHFHIWKALKEKLEKTKLITFNVVKLKSDGLLTNKKSIV